MPCGIQQAYFDILLIQVQKKSPPYRAGTSSELMWPERGACFGRRATARGRHARVAPHGLAPASWCEAGYLPVCRREAGPRLAHEGTCLGMRFQCLQGVHGVVGRKVIFTAGGD